MSTLAELDPQEHPIERLSRRQRAERLTSGARGLDGLTDAERGLLQTIRALGLDIQRAWMLNERSGQRWQAQRGIVRRAS